MNKLWTKIEKKSIKIGPLNLQKSWFWRGFGVKSRFGLVQGALGGGLGSHFGSQGRLGQQKGARRPKCVQFWAPIWKHFFEFFRNLLILFCTLFSSFHFGRYQNRFLMDFGVKMGAKMNQNSHKYRFFEKWKIAKTTLTSFNYWRSASSKTIFFRSQDLQKTSQKR